MCEKSAQSGAPAAHAEAEPAVPAALAPGRACRESAPEAPRAAGAGDSVRWVFYPRRMQTRPTRIDLLELDIDLRLADLWREAATIDEWSLEVVAAFMRAAYGKGYCDAFTEDSPGSLCHDHGYEIPGQQRTMRAA